MKIEKDTYIAFESGNYFAIAQEMNSNLVFYDIIQAGISSLYNFLDGIF